MIIYQDPSTRFASTKVSVDVSEKTTLDFVFFLGCIAIMFANFVSKGIIALLEEVITPLFQSYSASLAGAPRATLAEKSAAFLLYIGLVGLPGMGNSISTQFNELLSTLWIHFSVCFRFLFPVLVQSTWSCCCRATVRGLLRTAFYFVCPVC
jgi:hypothetical protein